MRKIIILLAVLAALAFAVPSSWFLPKVEEDQASLVAPTTKPTIQLVEDPLQNDEIVRLAATSSGAATPNPDLAIPAPGLLHQFGAPAASAQVSPTAHTADAILVKPVGESLTPIRPEASDPQSIEEDPAVAVLKDLANAETSPAARSGMLPGIVVRATSAPNEPTARPQATPTLSAKRLERVVGQPRGYAMLYLMHPRARQTVEREVEMMLRSEVGDLYLSTLVDGTFGTDWDYLEQVIRRLVVEGRTLTLALYLSNGPTMRKFNKTPIITPFSRIDPTEFRYLIQVDNEMQGVFKDTTIMANRIFALNKQLNVLNQNIAIVMLEDNLEQQSYRWMRKLAREVLDESTMLIRNPCPGCWEGNDTTGGTDPIEMHDPADLPALSSGDGYTLDGSGFRYPNEPPDEQLSIDEVKGLLDLGNKQSLRYFGLWRKQRQGLGQPLIHPDQRNYEVPSAEQEAQEIELLRYGLNPLR